jgi:Zn finger protein HypA/HybF involved in hydrogenase expression
MSSNPGEAEQGMAESAEQRQPRATEVNLLRCAQCGSISGLSASGWRGCRTDDPEVDLEPSLAFFCPACSAREFDAK